MKRILIVLAVLAFMAVPAMAADHHTLLVNVKLSIEAYCFIPSQPADVAIALLGGATEGSATIDGQATSNTAAAVTASVVGAPGTWTIGAITQPATPGVAKPFSVIVKVTVPLETAPQASLQAAVVTVTLTVPA